MHPKPNPKTSVNPTPSQVPILTSSRIPIPTQSSSPVSISVSNPYLQFYRQLKFNIRPDMPAQQAQNLSRQIALMHTALGTAMKDMTKLLSFKYPVTGGSRNESVGLRNKEGKKEKSSQKNQERSKMHDKNKSLKIQRTDIPQIRNPQTQENPIPSRNLNQIQIMEDQSQQRLRAQKQVSKLQKYGKYLQVISSDYEIENQQQVQGYNKVVRVENFQEEEHKSNEVIQKHSDSMEDQQQKMKEKQLKKNQPNLQPKPNRQVAQQYQKPNQPQNPQKLQPGSQNESLQQSQLHALIQQELIKQKYKANKMQKSKDPNTLTANIKQTQKIGTNQQLTQKQNQEQQKQKQPQKNQEKPKDNQIRKENTLDFDKKAQELQQQRKNIKPDFSREQHTWQVQIQRQVQQQEGVQFYAYQYMRNTRTEGQFLGQGKSKSLNLGNRFQNQQPIENKNTEVIVKINPNSSSSQSRKSKKNQPKKKQKAYDWKTEEVIDLESD